MDDFLQLVASRQSDRAYDMTPTCLKTYTCYRFDADDADDADFFNIPIRVIRV